jgi:hypothetical protein
MTSRSNCATEPRTFSINRPLAVAVSMGRPSLLKPPPHKLCGGEQNNGWDNALCVRVSALGPRRVDINAAKDGESMICRLSTATYGSARTLTRAELPRKLRATVR